VENKKKGLKKAATFYFCGFFYVIKQFKLSKINSSNYIRTL